MMQRHLLIIIITLFTTMSLAYLQAPPKEGHCHVLVLEGGGDKGAYQAGVISGLTSSLPDEDHQWQIVSGVSIGSINGAAMSIYEVGKEKEAAEFLLGTWRDITSWKQLYQNWWGGPLYGLFYKSSLYDNAPAREYINSIVKDQELKRAYVAAATSVEDGRYDSFDDRTLYRAEYADAILSSGAYPVMMPMNKFRNVTYIDGGVKINLNVFSAVNRCIDEGYSYEQIYVDAILCTSKNLEEFDKDKYHSLNVLERMVEIFGYDYSMRDLEYAYRLFPKVNFRYVVGPSVSLPSGAIPMAFKPAQIESMIQTGLKDGKAAVQKGAGVGFKEMLQKHKEDRMNLFMNTKPQKFGQ
jgi:predicted patatin/cPLA2 family phospholipase